MKRSELKRTPMKRKAPKRNDAPWRKAVLDLRGAFCRACGDSKDVQCDHVIERSQGGESVVENGLVLCGPWSRVTPGGCHVRKTEGRMLLQREWLDEDQLLYLANLGWVDWDADGSPFGRGMRAFAPVSRQGDADGSTTG